MVLIGMLHHRKYPHTVFKSYAFAVVAKAEGAEILYFSPKGVDFRKKIISGFIYQKGIWRKTVSPFPDVIYNAGSPEKLSISKDIVDKLRAEIPFTSHSIGNKMKVYERLRKAKEFEKYLIPYKRVNSTKGFFDFLHDYKKIVFKPVNGHKGMGIAIIEQTDNGYTLLDGAKHYNYNYYELQAYVDKMMDEDHYLVQKFIKCRAKSGSAYDLRLHVQKNGEGKWTIATIYPRIARNGSSISNLNNGGSTKFLEAFLKEEFRDEYYNVLRYLEHFSLQLANHLDKIQNESFNEALDELGIDVALDDNRKIWIYEVNWRPGPPITYYLELDAVRNMVRYAVYLANKGYLYKGTFD